MHEEGVMTKRNPRNTFTKHVRSRTLLAKELKKPEHAERIAKAGLVERDLTAIEASGEDAERYDREQHTDLADQRGALVQARARRLKIAAEEEGVRNRIPAVIEDLAADPATSSLGVWLDNVGFERFRLRTTSKTEVGVEEKSTERVVRTDQTSRAQELLHFTRALLEPARAPVVDAFAARGFGRERLAQLASDAEAMAASASTEKLARPDATDLESQAVIRQKKQWDSCRRMLREAVEGNPELERLFAAC
jgi:hypothetical protein